MATITHRFCRGTVRSQKRLTSWQCGKPTLRGTDYCKVHARQKLRESLRLVKKLRRALGESDHVSA